jgi:hypothetical protein
MLDCMERREWRWWVGKDAESRPVAFLIVKRSDTQTERSWLESRFLSIGAR